MYKRQDIAASAFAYGAMKALGHASRAIESGDVEEIDGMYQFITNELKMKP